MQTRSVLRPRIVLLLLMPLLLTACARATKAPAVLQGDFRVHDPSIMKQDGIKMRRIDPSTRKLAAADTKLYALASRGGGPIEAPSMSGAPCMS